jgi:uncharacterized protein (UPF0333 family)
MKKMFKFQGKSQAAMEFLMTYGWAILVVLVAIGALAYFGVLSPDKFLPSKCQLPAGMACTDHKADAGASSVTVVLRNGMGFDANSITIDITGCATSATGSLTNGQQTSFTASTCSLTSGGKFSGEVNVTYTNADTSLTHKVQGSITTRAE